MQFYFSTCASKDTLLVHTLTPAFSSHCNSSLLSPTGLQHPRQRRPALSGTLQSTPRPPRAGNYPNIPLCWWVGVISTRSDRCGRVWHSELLNHHHPPPTHPSSRPSLCLFHTSLPWLWITCTVTSCPVTEYKLLHVNRRYCGYVGMGGGWHGRNVLGLSCFSPAGEKSASSEKEMQESAELLGRRTFFGLCLAEALLRAVS